MTKSSTCSICGLWGICFDGNHGGRFVLQPLPMIPWHQWVSDTFHSLIITMWHIIRQCWHIIRHWCLGIMGKGWWTNLHPWLPSKQIPYSVKANPQMEQVDDFVTSIYQHAHLLGGTQVSRNHGWGLMEQSTRRALALQVVLFCPNLFENCLIICQHWLLMPNNVSALWWLMCDTGIWIFLLTFWTNMGFFW